jgi:hypothetical protein
VFVPNHMKLMVGTLEHFNWKRASNQTLHWATHYGLHRVIGILLVFGANLSIRNAKGETPLDTASTNHMADFLNQTQLELSRTPGEIKTIREQQRGQLGRRNATKSVTASYCDVCMLGWPSGKLVTCVSCGLSVHLSCYETPKYLDNFPLRDTFLCDPCLYSCGAEDLLPTKVRCVLCPAVGGKVCSMLMMLVFFAQ